MKMALAGITLVAALAACAGGVGTSPSPIATATAAPQAFHPQALGPAPTQTNGSPLPYAAVTVPFAGFLNDTGEAFALATSVPVYSIGAGQGENVAFTFGPNSSGLPVATQVGTASTGVDLDVQAGLLVHWPYLNNDPSVPCAMDARGPVLVNGVVVQEEIDYFVCGGTP